MGRQMTSWTLNAVLASMAAAVLLLPNPAEIRKALEYSQEQRSLSIEPTSSVQPTLKILVPDPLRPTAFEVQYAPSVECLEQENTGSLDALSTCIRYLVEDVSEFDRFAQQMKSEGLPIRPHPEIEKTRLALINLCRAKWAAQIQQGNGPDLDQCHEITVGIAY